ETFVIKEEEGAVFYDWSSESESELVANERWFDASSRLEEADGIEHGIAMIFPQTAVKLIGPGAVRCVDHGAGAASEFRAISVGLDLELLDGVRRDLDDLARKALIAGAIRIVVDAIQQEVIDRIAQPVDVEGGFAPGSRDAVLRRFAHAGGQQRKVGVGPAVERKVHDLLALYNLASNAGISFEQSHAGRDYNAFAHGAGLHCQINPLPGIDCDVDTLGDCRRKPLLFRADSVVADPHISGLKIALGVSLCADRYPCVDVLQGHSCAGDHGTV